MAELETGTENPLPASLRGRTALGYQPPAWLERWSPFEAVPVAPADVSRALIAAQEAIEPAPRADIVAGLDRIFWLHNPPPRAAALTQWWRENRGFYIAALADLPGDLVEAAFRHVALNCPFVPKPADFRRAVEDQLGARHAAVRRLGWAAEQLAKATAAPSLAAPTPDEAAAARERLRHLAMRLKGGANLPVPAPKRVDTAMADDQLSLVLE